MKSQPLISSKTFGSPRATNRQRIAEALFCSDKFAMTDFRKMDTEDWKLHAARAWEIAEIFVTETKRRRDSDGASEPFARTRNEKQKIHRKKLQAQ
jgi:hypothetical protein